jgi:hypothetical protein
VKIDGLRVFSILVDAEPAKVAIGQTVRLSPLSRRRSRRERALAAGVPSGMKVLIAKPGLDGHDRGAR